MPFHMWAPDVYEGAPTTVTAFMAAGVKAAAFGALLRVFELGAALARPRTGSRSWRCSRIVTMIVGNLAALAADEPEAHARLLVDRPRRLPADRARGRAGSSPGEAVLFYLVAYAAVNLGAFGAIAALSRDGREPLAVADLAGLAERRPGARRRAHRLPRLAHRHPAHGRLRRQVLPLQRRGRPWARWGPSSPWWACS